MRLEHAWDNCLELFYYLRGVVLTIRGLNYLKPQQRMLYWTNCCLKTLQGRLIKVVGWFRRFYDLFSTTYDWRKRLSNDSKIPGLSFRAFNDYFSTASGSLSITAFISSFVFVLEFHGILWDIFSRSMETELCESRHVMFPNGGSVLWKEQQSWKIITLMKEVKLRVIISWSTCISFNPLFFLASNMQFSSDCGPGM